MKEKQRKTNLSQVGVKILRYIYISYIYISDIYSNRGSSQSFKKRFILGFKNKGRSESLW